MVMKVPVIAVAVLGVCVLFAGEQPGNNFGRGAVRRR